MSLYAEYLKERLGDEAIENDYGFATYRFLNEKQVYLIDLYVRPEFRKSKIASEMADMICKLAKDRGCTELIGSVSPGAKSSTESLMVLLAYGMRLQSSTDNLIFFKKDLV